MRIAPITFDTIVGVLLTGLSLKARMTRMTREQELTQWFASRRQCAVVTIPCEGRCICREDAKAFMASFG